MKTPKILLLALIVSVFFSCDNDDGNADNQNACNFEGATFEWSNNTFTTYPEADLKAELFLNNFGVGIPGIEIWDTTNAGNTFIVTRALTAGAVDNNPEIRIEGVDYTGVVTCQRITGMTVGDEIRYDIVINGTAEAEFCGDIDTVTP